MEIKLPPQLLSQPASPQSNKPDSLPLQLNQQLDVKVLDSKIGQNAIALQIGNQSIHVKSEQPLELKNNQELTLKIIKLQPLLEFKIVEEKPEKIQQSGRFADLSNSNKSPEVILKQIQPEAVKALLEAKSAILKSAETILRQAPPTIETNRNISEVKPDTLKNLTHNQAVTLKLVSVTPKEISGIVISETTPKNVKPAHTVTIALNQISNASTSKTGEPHVQNLPIKPEQLITLESIKHSDPLQFKIVPNTTPAAIDYVISETIKRHLPQQDSPLPLLEQLSATLSSADSEHSNVPETLKRLAREILQNLPQRTQLSQPDSLKQLLKNSGRFLETKLANLVNDPGLNLQDDFKLKLLKLITLLQQHIEPKPDQKNQLNETTENFLKELLQKSNSTLARVVIDQLNSLPKEDGLKQTWILELPFQNQQMTEQATIEIEQHKHADKHQQKNSWSVNITVSPPKLGTIHCKIFCIDQVISTRFWSEQQSTVTKINRHLEYLRRQLEKNGLKPGVLEVQQGKPKQNAQEEFSGRNLLNEEV